MSQCYADAIKKPLVCWYWSFGEEILVNNQENLSGVDDEEVMAYKKKTRSLQSTNIIEIVANYFEMYY